MKIITNLAWKIRAVWVVLTHHNLVILYAKKERVGANLVSAFIDCQLNIRKAIKDNIDKVIKDLEV